MTFNDRDAKALTYLACRIRKETHGCREWDDAGVYAELTKMLGQSLVLTIERVTRHAGDPEAKTPGAIRRPFIPPAQVAGPRFPAKAGEDCRRHPGEHPESCRLCPVEAIAHPEDPTPGDGSDGAALLADIRARRERTDHRTTTAREGQTETNEGASK